MDKTATIELNVQQLNVVMLGLSKLPIETALDTFNAVDAQARAQFSVQPAPQGPLQDKVIN